MVVSSASLELVAVGNKSIGESPRVSNDLLSVGLPRGIGSLLQSGGNGGDGLSKDMRNMDNTLFEQKSYVVVRTTLAGREDGFIHALLEVLSVLEILPEEDETSSRATEGLVTARVVRLGLVEQLG